MNNTAVNAAAGTAYPLGGIDSQSIYEYFANAGTGSFCGSLKNRYSGLDSGLHFLSMDNVVRRPCRVFNRGVKGGGPRPYHRVLQQTNAVLTAWQASRSNEPAEFQLLDLGDMSHENVAWLRADGEINLMTVDKAEKLVALVYHDERWRIDIRRTNNFQLREVVHHNVPVSGLFFYNDLLFSLSDKLVVSYPEDRYENAIVCSGGNILGWAHHPKDPYLLIVQAECFRILDLNTLRVVKAAPWTEAIRWFNILQRYSAHSLSMEQHLNRTTVTFSKDGNRLLMGGYGRLAVFDWHDMLRPRCEQPKPEKIINLHPEKYISRACKLLSDSHIIDLVAVNRDRVLFATAEGYLCMVNIRSDEVTLLLKPGIGVRINSLQLDSKGRYLAMAGYHYGFDNRECTVESALLLWKMSSLVSNGTNI